MEDVDETGLVEFGALSVFGASPEPAGWRVPTLCITTQRTHLLKVSMSSYDHVLKQREAEIRKRKMSVVTAVPLFNDWPQLSLDR